MYFFILYPLPVFEREQAKPLFYLATVNKTISTIKAIEQPRKQAIYIFFVSSLLSFTSVKIERPKRNRQPTHNQIKPISLLVIMAIIYHFRKCKYITNLSKNCINLHILYRVILTQWVSHFDTQKLARLKNGVFDRLCVSCG